MRYRITPAGINALTDLTLAGINALTDSERCLDRSALYAGRFISQKGTFFEEIRVGTPNLRIQGRTHIFENIAF